MQIVEQYWILSIPIFVNAFFHSTMINSLLHFFSIQWLLPVTLGEILEKVQYSVNNELIWMNQILFTLSKRRYCQLIYSFWYIEQLYLGFNSFDNKGHSSSYYFFFTMECNLFKGRLQPKKVCPFFMKIVRIGPNLKTGLAFSYIVILLFERKHFQSCIFLLF